MRLRKLIYFEYAVGFILCLLLYMHFNYSLLLFFLLLFVPDITMVGYFVNNKFGSYIYNLGHNLILPLSIFLLAILNEYSILLMATIIWIAHIYMDRALGFGLKYEHSFKETHLQKIA